MFKKVDPKMNLPKMEEEILSFWNSAKIFEKSLEIRESAPLYSFFDGPPFATGTPHYGHIVASTMKDIVPRFWTMKGRYVPRKWGWDCHGLPIENIAEKSLGIGKKKEIEEMGVEIFNAACRSKVLEYVGEWEKVINRLGRWADMKNAYRTMDLPYTESVWWVFKQLYDKGLIYEGYRSMHICPRCETTLSQSEVTEGYKMIKDLTCIAKFHLKPAQEWGNGFVTKDTAYILAWTTTPWTLIGNVALAVGGDIKYTAFRIKGIPELFIAAKDRVKDIIKDQEIEIVHDNIPGNDLIGLEYEPLFNYYYQNTPNWENGWKIYGADFVTTEEGTGIVHIAPAFGEDDMNLGKEYNLPFVQHVGMDGLIKPEAGEFAGMHVKDPEDYQKTDIEIIKYLAKHNLLFVKEKYEHSYPHCWRCDTPLINYATSSWFVKITEIKDRAIELAKKINWSPKHIKQGRFGKWLEGARDWSISRQRYWASVMPIWRCECGGITVVGSVDELRKLAKDQLTKIIFIRHGESEKNVKSILSNSLDKWPLTENGLKATDSLKDKINDPIDLIITSPILRAKETAEILNQKFKVQIIEEDLIKELGYGEWNDKNKEEIAHLESRREYELRKNDSQYHFNVKMGKTGESRQDVLKRTREFLRKIALEHKGKIILIVSHGTNYATTKMELEGLSAEEYFRMDMEDPGHDSIAEFYITSDGKLFDLHKDKVDKISFLCPDCGKEMKRIPDVLDTWFDSGSMPYAQLHYPFENQEVFGQGFPAEFIAEGQDQTRAWFYYLHSIATAIKDSIAFKNVVVNGIVLAEDGKKMSKKLKNYPDPMEMFNKYGADAVRLYLTTSPVMSAENLNFKEPEVAELYRGVFRMLWNSYSFFVLYASIDNWTEEKYAKSDNILDRWIISRLNIFNKEVQNALEKYELTKAARFFTPFVDDLSNWYIRRSRKRFWKSEDDLDKNSAYSTLYTALIQVAKIVAPFVPFISEEIFKNLSGKESVHLEEYPIADNELIDIHLMEQMTLARRIIEEGLSGRAEAGIKVRQPLRSLTYSGDLPKELEEIIADEVNIKEIKKKASGPVDIDTEITQELKLEGNAREIIRNIQSLRKETGFNIEDRIIVYYQTDSTALMETFAQFGNIIASEVLALNIFNERAEVDGQNEYKLDGESIWIGIKKSQ